MTEIGRFFLCHSTTTAALLSITLNQQQQYAAAVVDTVDTSFDLFMITTAAFIPWSYEKSKMAG